MLYSIDIIGIVVAAVLYFILAGLWFSPMLFGKRFMKYMGIPENMTFEERAAGKKSANRAMVVSAVTSLIVAFAIERVMYHTPLVTMYNTLVMAIILWLGFVVATNINEYIYVTKPRPWGMFAISMGFHLVGILLASIILFFI